MIIAEDENEDDLQGLDAGDHAFNCALSKRRSVFARLSLQLFLLKTICRSSFFKQVFVVPGYFYLLHV